MAEAPPFSSQGSQYEQHQILREQENFASSPLAPRSTQASKLSSQKPKKPPTVTPRRFDRFFAPRDTRSGRQSKASRQLRDITKNGANRRRHVRPSHNSVFDPSEDKALSERPLKRQKHYIDISSSPPQSSPLKHVQTTQQIKVFEDVPSSPAASNEDALSAMLEELQPFPRPNLRLRQGGRSQRILQRSFGAFDALAVGRRGSDHCADWINQTANFVSTPSDIHAFNGTTLPFCTASCNTNSLIAIGEEEGKVRLIDSAPTSDFTKTHVAFRPHHNAIMDLTFSSDDYLLATASGDQTARIIDMHTQRTICILSGHKSSVKQVRFQPSDDNVITTSSRDGSVLLWDMRCGGIGTVASLNSNVARSVAFGDVEPTVRYAKHALDVGTAHRSTKGASIRTSSMDNSDGAGVSITAIQHLPPGREHLLLTTSEISSSIKLWDLRNVGRRVSNSLLSSIPEPDQHRRTRKYGINAMALSGDGARLYTACRDGIVYAYSTNHLVLGCAPELSSSKGKGRMQKDSKTGIGPLYGLKHPSLRMGSFYVKASLRPAKGDMSEMLALGSSDNCAVLFPTDERYLPVREWLTAREEGDGVQEDIELPSLSPTPGQKPRGGQRIQEVPIYEHGTSLIRGHSKEVTSVAWSHDGELITVCDDFNTRCWREDGNEARELRGCGEGGGRRWGRGWADVETAWDQDE